MRTSQNTPENHIMARRAVPALNFVGPQIEGKRLFCRGAEYSRDDRND
jgi:hypothetical protein